MQQDTCSPMVSAWADGSERIGPEHIVHRPTGIAQAILRGNPTRAYPHVRRIVLESGGEFVSVSEAEIRSARDCVEDLEGLSPCFTAAAAVAGAIKLRRRGELPPEDTVLINLTGSDRNGSGSPAGAQWRPRTDRGWDLEAIPG